MDLQLLNGYVLGLIGLFAACLLLLVAALCLRDLIRWLSKVGTAAKQFENLENCQKADTPDGSIPGNQPRAGFGIPSRDQAPSHRDLGGIQRSDR